MRKHGSYNPAQLVINSYLKFNRHWSARARRRRALCAAVILVKVTILTLENLFPLTCRRRERDVVNQRAAAISKVYFPPDFVNFHPRTFDLIKVGP